MRTVKTWVIICIDKVFVLCKQTVFPNASKGPVSHANDILSHANNEWEDQSMTFA